MPRYSPGSAWAKAFNRSFAAFSREAVRANSRAARLALKAPTTRARPPPGDGDWLAGMAIGAAGVRRYRLFRPAGVALGERLPLVVMLHGCGQDARSFALATRMNRIAARERFLVLYPEQDRMANPQGCWNWFDIQSGRAYGEAAVILSAIEQVCLLYRVDRSRIAIAGLSAGASMAALLATRHPGRFKAVVMHSGVPPGSAHSTLSAVSAMHFGRGAPRPAIAAAAQGEPLPPLLVIHGSSDRVVSRQNAQTAARLWSQAGGGLAVAAREVRRGKRYPMTVTDYKRGPSTVATLVEVQQLGHAWSGGAARTAHSDGRGPDASRMIWTFAARQFEISQAAPS